MSTTTLTTTSSSSRTALRQGAQDQGLVNLSTWWICHRTCKTCSSNCWRPPRTKKRSPVTILRWSLRQDGRGMWPPCHQGTFMTASSSTSLAQIMRNQAGQTTRRSAQTCSTTASPTWTSTTTPTRTPTAMILRKTTRLSSRFPFLRRS